MRVAREIDAQRLANGGTPAIGANETGGEDPPRAACGFDLHRDLVVILVERNDAGGEFDRRIGQRAEPLQRDRGELVLLALHHIGVARVVLQPAKIELGDNLAARAVPDAESRFDQAATDHVVDHSELFQHLQGCGMRGRGPRAVVDAAIGLEHRYLEALTGEREGGDETHRAAAGDDDRTFELHAPFDPANVDLRCSSAYRRCTTSGNRHLASTVGST